MTEIMWTTVCIFDGSDGTNMNVEVDGHMDKRDSKVDLIAMKGW